MPGSVCRRGLILREAKSETSSRECRSLVNPIHMIGHASASVLEMTGSSMSRGSRPRTRATLSRTSAAAASESRESEKRMVMSLRSVRETDEITSTPSMPESESSSTLVTWDSITSEDAPR